MRLPLHLSRLSLYAALLLLVVSQQSCLPQSDIEASFDGHKIHESGNSARVYSDDYGMDLGLSFTMGMGKKGLSNKASADESYDAPATSDAGLYIVPKLEFIQKGAKDGDAKIKLNYLNAMGTVIYSWPMQDKGTVFGGLGPYIGYGISGHVKGAGFSESAFGSDGLKRFDAGLHLTAGYRFSMGLFLSLAYEYGLYNQSRFDDYSSYNRSYSLQVGYPIQKIIDGFKKK
ncbi:MAG TPA: outer membrane beta-barrel protein [Puia sp.]|jgi:hypothetical protein|nr:outer membrane beta-barrel protein [Puia sp.]